jgi:hypothetical protein
LLQGGIVPERADFLAELAREVAASRFQDRQGVFLAAVVPAFLSA